MIFCHNTYNRPHTVLETILKEKKEYPSAKFILVYNNNKLDLSQLNKEGVICFYIGENKGHKLGCINSVYSCLKIAYKIAEDRESILFSHDDTYLSNKIKFEKSLNLLEKHNFVSRRYIGSKHSNSDFYIMMESFLIKKESIPSFIEEYKHNQIDILIKDKLGSECPEMSFGKDVITHIENPYLFDIENNVYGENIMGYYHIKNVRGQGD